MSESVEEAIQEAIDEIKLKEWVIDAWVDETVHEIKHNTYVRKRLDVLHQVSQGDYTSSGKELYINLTDFTYLWHYGGATVESISTPFRDLVESKIDIMITSMGVDWAEIIEANEITESGIVLAVKGTTGNNADTYTIKVWKTGDTTVGYKIISKTTVE